MNFSEIEKKATKERLCTANCSELQKKFFLEIIINNK